MYLLNILILVNNCNMAAHLECPICYEDYNKSSNKPLKCPYCSEEMCRSCTEKSIIYDIGDPGCQSCKKEWPDDVLYSFFTKKFVNTAITAKREKKYSELEESLLPESQYYAAKIKEVRKMCVKALEFDRSEIEQIKYNAQLIGVRIKTYAIGRNMPPCDENFLNNPSRLTNVTTNWASYHHSYSYSDLNKRVYYAAYWNKKPDKYSETQLQNIINQLDDYNDNCFKYQQNQSSLRIAYERAEHYLLEGIDVILKDPIGLHLNRRINAIEFGGGIGGGIGGGVDDKYAETHKKGNVKYIKKCASESCHGYINDQSVCDLCDTVYCKKCEEVKKDKHICNKDNIESVKMKYKNSKPCPNKACGVPIFKTSGCSQMWCTACHTVFDWNTQCIVVTKNIHNPHYIDYARAKQTIEPDEGECGRPSSKSLEDAAKRIGLDYVNTENTRRYGGEDIEHCKTQFVLEFRRILGEILDNTILMEYRVTPYTVNSLKNTRIKVMAGLASKSSLAQEALLLYRTNTFNAKARELFYMLCTTGIDILRKFADPKNSTSDLYKYYVELYNLCCMFNQEGRKLHNTYKKSFTYLTWRCCGLMFSSSGTIAISKKGLKNKQTLFEYCPHMAKYIQSIKDKF